MMRTNMGSIDRVLRSFVVAPVAIVVAIVVGAGSVLGIVLLALAAVMLVTSAVGFCPLYKALGLNTCSRNGARRGRQA
ncbi:MAG: YgaP family membrane protein [Gaiellaceae bacterium]